MKSKITLLLFSVILLVALTGCWDRRELPELAIATAMGIDKSEDGYLVTVQLVNPPEVSAQVQSEHTEITTYQTTGSTIFEALRKITKDSPKVIYLSHLRIVVFGEELAREGIAKPLDFISRDHEFRTDFFILVAKGGKATDVLGVLTPLDKLPANNIFETLKISSARWAESYYVQLEELIVKLVSKGCNPVLTGIIVKGNPEEGGKISNIENVKTPTHLEITTLSVFKKDKLIGWLTTDESIGYNHILGNVKSTIVVIPTEEGGKISIEVIRTKVKVKGKVKKGVPKIEIDYKVETNIGEVESEVDLTKTENIYKLEKTLSDEIKSKMEEVIKVTQEEYKTDIFGFGDAIHRADYKTWNKLEDNWDKTYENLEVTIKVDAKIRRIGTITESFLKDAKE